MLRYYHIMELGKATCSFLLIQMEYERRFLELCYEGHAGVDSFIELLQLGVDPNIHDKVCWSLDACRMVLQSNLTQYKWLDYQGGLFIVS